LPKTQGVADRGLAHPGVTEGDNLAMLSHHYFEYLSMQLELRKSLDELERDYLKGFNRDYVKLADLLDRIVRSYLAAESRQECFE
jgi:hypothetical protein